MQGILRGFDPFMNLVVDDSLEMGPGGQQNSIGMVVSTLAGVILLFFLSSENSKKRTGLCLKSLQICYTVHYIYPPPFYLMVKILS